MNRDQVRARAKELGIKNVSSYSKAELEDMIRRAEELALISSVPAQAAAEAIERVKEAVQELDEEKTLVPNRSEMRARGSQFGFYRMPRRKPKRTGSANHWLSKQREQREFERMMAALDAPGPKVTSAVKQHGKGAAPEGEA